MSFPFMKDVQLPHYKEDCTAAFFDAIRRLDMESVSQFIEAKPPGFLSSLVDAQGNSPLHVALQVAVAQAATQAASLTPLQQEMVQLFLTLQCDERQRNKQGVTPLDLAAQCPSAAVRSLFPALSGVESVEGASPMAESEVESGKVVESVRMPVESVRMPVESVRLPVESVRMPVESVRMPVESVRMPVESVRMPVESVRMPVESVRIPIEPTTRIPVEPTRIPMEPTRITMEPITKISIEPTTKIPIEPTPIRTSVEPATPKSPSEPTTKPSEETGNEEADEEASPSASQTQLQPSSTVEELLQTLGLQEYIDVFRAKVRERRKIKHRATRCVPTSLRSTRRISRRWE